MLFFTHWIVQGKRSNLTYYEISSILRKHILDLMTSQIQITRIQLRVFAEKYLLLPVANIHI